MGVLDDFLFFVCSEKEALKTDLSNICQSLNRFSAEYRRYSIIVLGVDHYYELRPGLSQSELWRNYPSKGANKICAFLDDSTKIDPTVGYIPISLEAMDSLDSLSIPEWYIGDKTKDGYQAVVYRP